MHEPWQTLKSSYSPAFWETDFYTAPVLGGAALCDNSVPAVYKILCPKDAEFYTLLVLNCQKVGSKKKTQRKKARKQNFHGIVPGFGGEFCFRVFLPHKE